MYIVTFIQSDSNNVDSNLCSTPQEVFKLIEDFFMLADFQDFSDFKESMGSLEESTTKHVGCYTTIHVQPLSNYSRQQLLLANQEKPLAPIKPYKINLHFRNGEPTVTRIYETIEDAQWAFNVFYMRRPMTSEIAFQAEGWEEEKPQEPFDPFVVAATLPDYSQVILGRFDNEADQKMFEMNCSLYSYEECKCAVCGKVLGEDDEVYIDHYSGQPLCDSHSRFNEELDCYEATEGDLEYRRRTVNVILEDGDSFITSINGSKRAVEKYYATGRTLNIGVAEDYMVAIKEIIFC